VTREPRQFRHVNFRLSASIGRYFPGPDLPPVSSSPGVEAVLAAQFCDVRFETQPPGKSRFVAIGCQ
jgi:hypothetical protein